MSDIPIKYSTSRAKTAAHEITKLFDNDWKFKTSALREKFDVTREYDPKSSWNGKSQTSEVFARSANNITVPFQRSNPVGQVGSQIVKLESSIGLEVSFTHRIFFADSNEV